MGQAGLVPPVSPYEGMEVTTGPSMVQAGKAQRGFITNYLTSLTTDQIISNTLTGFLINLIRKRGNLMQFSLIVAYVQDRFDTLRKPNGKPYKHPKGNIKRSIMCSLTSNGVFQKVASPPAATPGD